MGLATLITLLIYLPPCWGAFNSLHYPPYGVFMEPDGYAANPYHTKLITINVAFDNPFMGESPLQSKCVDEGLINESQLTAAKEIISTMMQDIALLLNPRYNKYSYQFCKDIDHLCDRDADGIPDHEDPTIGTFGNPGYQGKTTGLKHHRDRRSSGNTTSVDKNNHALSRKKRAGPLLLVAAAGVGLFVLASSIYSWITTKQLSDRISQQEDNQDKIIQAIHVMYGITHDFRKSEEDVYNALRSIIPELVRKDNRQDCSVYTNKLDLFVSYAYQTRETIVRILNSALQGTVTTEMVTAHELRQVILNDKDFENSVYHEDIDLYYRLSMVIPLAYHQKEHVLSLAVAIPMISNGDIAPLYFFYNFGWVSSGRLYQLGTPDVISIITEEKESHAVGEGTYSHKQIIPIERTNCQLKGMVYLCPSTNYELTPQTACAQQLIRAQGDKIPSVCKHYSKIYDPSTDKKLQSFKSGVFVRGYSRYTLQHIIRGSIIQPTEVQVDPINNTIIPYDSFDFLQVGTRSISKGAMSITTAVTYSHKPNLSAVDNMSIDHLLDKDTWKEIDKDMEKLKQDESELKKYMDFNDSKFNTDKSISIVIIILVIAILIVLFLMKRKYNRMKHQVRQAQQTGRMHRKAILEIASAR